MPALLLLAVLAQTPKLDLAPPNDDSDGIRAERVPLEILGGTATGILAGFAGAAILCSSGNCGGDENLAVVGYFLITAPLGISAGITLVGYLMDGNGSYLASTGGVLAGVLIDYLIINGAQHDLGTAMDLAMVALPLVGGVVGYELTSDAHRSAIKKVRLAPMAGAHGAVGLALTGAF